MSFSNSTHSGRFPSGIISDGKKMTLERTSSNGVYVMTETGVNASVEYLS